MSADTRFADVPMDAHAIAAAVGCGALNPHRVLEATRARIAAHNAELNAVVGEEPVGLDTEADRLIRRITRGEKLPLAGVPVVVKDVIWVAGQKVTQGSLLFKDSVAPRDALAVARLRAAGALIVGMANMAEFACKGLTTNKVYGLTRHHLDPRLTPGGSSGGSAVAVAAGFVPLALGTDGGGSGRRPPAHVGAVGFKPSQGAIPDPDAYPHAFPNVQVVAPIGRNVADVALMYAVMAGPDPRDPSSLLMPDAHPIQPARRLRLAWSPTCGFVAPVDDDVAAGLQRAIDVLRASDFRIADVDPAWPEGIDEAALMSLQHCGLAHLFGDEWKRDASRFDPDIAKQIERGLTHWSGVDVARARSSGVDIAGALASFMQQHDLLLCPTVPCVAWPSDRLGPAMIGGRSVEPRAHAVFTPFINHAQAPAISIPCGRGRDGLPIGLQIIAARGRDNQLLAAAREIEAALAAGGIL